VEKECIVKQAIIHGLIYIYCLRNNECYGGRNKWQQRIKGDKEKGIQGNKIEGLSQRGDKAWWHSRVCVAGI
jgi:hypothetical protein